MKSYKNIFYTVCLTGFVALCTSSCTDWLTIYPQNRVVEENFWEDKNDLEGVRNAAYRQMAQTAPKFAVWGDLRSDSYLVNSVEHSDQGNRDMYIEIINGMPDSSMSVFDWSGVYTTINYCNKVLQHGAEVLEKDKQFSNGEWIQMRAEMIALRALNYFYLIRAFKDVPYTTKVINKDTEVEAFPLTNQLVVLDSIIKDCEEVKGKARNRYSNNADSKGMITNSAIYAMLADMYLWRAALHEGRHGKTNKIPCIINGEEKTCSITEDYNRVIENADLCLTSLADQNEENRNSSGLISISEETEDYGLGKGCAMIKNNFLGASQSTTPKLEAQTSIFQDGNSRESIFELQYSNDDHAENNIVNSLFGFSNGTHLMVNKDAFDLLYDSGTTGEGDNGGAWDSRLWVCCQNKLMTGSSTSNSQAQSGYYCMKYHLPASNILVMEGSTTNREIKGLRYTSTKYNHWIVYRMTDVMLMKAEALAAQNKTNDVKAICNAIHRRSYCNYKNGLVPSTDASSEKTNNKIIGNTKAAKKTTEKTNVTVSELFMYVLNERQIELIGEGKRWFDLVRLAERCSSPDGATAKTDPEDPREKGTENYTIKNGQTGMSAMVELFLGTGSNAQFATTLINRFKNRYGLYCPIYEMEVKASGGAIDQNPVWNKSKYEQ